MSSVGKIGYAQRLAQLVKKGVNCHTLKEFGLPGLSFYLIISGARPYQLRELHHCLLPHQPQSLSHC